MQGAVVMPTAPFFLNNRRLQKLIPKGSIS